MEIQSIRPYGNNTSFNGIERMASKNVANVALVGGGGRIGRNVLREYLLANHAPKGVYNTWDRLKEVLPLLNIVAINMGSMGLKGDKTIKDVGDEDLLAQIRNDSVLGRLPECIATSIKRNEDGDVFLHVESQNKQEDINLVATRADVDFSKWNAEVMLDATGARTSKAAMKELLDTTSTAKYALLSAPSKEKDKSVTPMPTIVAGVNSERIADIKNEGRIASAASCTTTCIAPIIKLMNDKFGVASGYIETVHAATATQFTADKSNKEADSKKRGSFDSMIPTTTGAAKAVGLVLPELKGKLNGTATRVPTADGSLAVITLNLKNPTTVDELKQAFKDAANSEEYKNLIAMAPKGSSSRDVIGRHESALVVPESIMMIGDNMAVIKAYYDNEFGYTRSYLTLANEVAKDVIAEKA
jgi:glyceraldehyde 3-phosphate dehydrogenase